MDLMEAANRAAVERGNRLLARLRVAEARVADLEAGIRKNDRAIRIAQEVLAMSPELCRTDPCPTCVFGEDIEAVRHNLRALVGDETPGTGEHDG